jgi:photosystem II stability/assembly factor-like uncharacterized protein
MTSIRIVLLSAFVAGVSCVCVAAQSKVGVWQMQESGTTAGLRGIDSVDGTVAWASGTSGTVLRTTDGGADWQRCATPDADKDGATLDFRGVQAWDVQTAIVMASGPGDKSRLYKTGNGCKSWKLILRNKARDGFWDGFSIQEKQLGWLVGDPVGGRFVLLGSVDGGSTWTTQRNDGLSTAPSPQGAFAASNTALTAQFGEVWFVTGGKGGAYLYNGSETQVCLDDCPAGVDSAGKKYVWRTNSLPMGSNKDSSGAFSIAVRTAVVSAGRRESHLVAVGGDYTKPNDSMGTAAWSADGGKHWTAATTPPHGYRSAVQWSEALKAWITVGTNGSDISRDDGKTWQPLDEGNWNALSLPFVVGPNGRIARINSAAVPSAAAKP